MNDLSDLGGIWPYDLEVCDQWCWQLSHPLYGTQVFSRETMVKNKLPIYIKTACLRSLYNLHIHLVIVHVQYLILKITYSTAIVNTE